MGKNNYGVKFIVDMNALEVQMENERELNLEEMTKVRSLIRQCFRNSIVELPQGTPRVEVSVKFRYEMNVNSEAVKKLREKLTGSDPNLLAEDYSSLTNNLLAVALKREYGGLD